MWAKLSDYLTYLGKAIQSRGNSSNKNVKELMYHGLGIVLVQTTITNYHGLGGLNKCISLSLGGW